MAGGEWWFGSADISKFNVFVAGGSVCRNKAERVLFLLCRILRLICCVAQIQRNSWTPGWTQVYLISVAVSCKRMQKADQPFLPHMYTICSTYFLMRNLVLWAAASLLPAPSQNIAAIEQWKQLWLFWFCWRLCCTLPFFHDYIIQIWLYNLNITYIYMYFDFCPKCSSDFLAKLPFWRNF